MLVWPMRRIIRCHGTVGPAANSDGAMAAAGITIKSRRFKGMTLFCASGARSRPVVETAWRTHPQNPLNRRDQSDSNYCRVPLGSEGRFLWRPVGTETPAGGNKLALNDSKRGEQVYTKGYLGSKIQILVTTLAMRFILIVERCF